MPTASRPWRRNSTFGSGFRVPLCREKRAVWRARLDLARRAGRITPLAAEVGRALLTRLAVDGRCDPALATIAADAGASVRSVQRAVAALCSCGLLTWTRRLVRTGWRAAQTSNAYVLTVGDPPAWPAARCGGQRDRQTRRPDSSAAQTTTWQPPPEADREAARSALAAVRASRAATIARLLTGGRATARR
jgi:hypothetical protein